MSMQILLSFLLAMVVSAMLIPVVMKVGSSLDVVAKMNKRTVHKHEIVRIGGLAVYIAFLLGVVLFLQTDSQINSILLAGFLIFIVGLLDDIYDLPAKVKLIGEFAASMIVIFYGDIQLQGFSNIMPFLPEIITTIWIVGITNSINLIDGLDGLSGGISVIVLVTVSITSLLSGRVDIASLSLLLAGAVTGFLFFNFHPAKIFLGDCGALFVGFMIAVISLLGFGYSVSAFFTLGAPIIALMVPITDTILAIIRRKLKNKKFSDADRHHLHHRLMFKAKLGHTRSVIVLYAVTILFSITSFLYLYDVVLGTVMFIVLFLIFELFVEYTNMISRNFKPLLTIANIFIQSKRLPTISAVENYRNSHIGKKHPIRKVVGIVFSIAAMVAIMYYAFMQSMPKETPVIDIPYTEVTPSSVLMNMTYTNLETAVQAQNSDQVAQLVAAYFLQQYLSPQYSHDVVEGLEYVLPEIREDFEKISNEQMTLLLDTYPNLEVTSYEIISFSPSKLQLDGFVDNRYYSVLIDYKFSEEVEELQEYATVTVMENQGVFYVVGIENN